MHFDAYENTLALVKTGSRMYGLESDTSDYDYFCILVPPKRVRESFYLKFDNAELTGKYPHDFGVPEGSKLDVKGQSLKEFFRLAAAGKPQPLEILFSRDPIEHGNPELWQYLHDHRQLFLSKNCLTPFRGYATSMVGKEFDKGPKASCHALRLMHNAYSILKHQDFNPYVANQSPKAQKNLLAVKQGLVPKEQLIEWLAQLSTAVDAELETSKLPQKPNYEQLDALLSDITDTWDHDCGFGWR